MHAQEGAAAHCDEWDAAPSYSQKELASFTSIITDLRGGEEGRLGGRWFCSLLSPSLNTRWKCSFHLEYIAEDIP